MRVDEIMTPNVIGVPEDASLWDALKLMVERKVSALIVLDGVNAPIGVLSEGDLMRRAEFGAEKRHPRWLELLLGDGRAARDYARSHGRRVDELMTRGVIEIEAAADVKDAVDLMTEKRIRRLLVVRGSQPVGVLSRSDLVRALMRSLPSERQTRPDADIQADIEAEVRRQSWTPGAAVRIVVESGVATLEGTIFQDSLREGLKVLAENVAGVKSVRDQLAWIEPNSGYLVGMQGL